MKYFIKQKYINIILWLLILIIFNCGDLNNDTTNDNRAEGFLVSTPTTVIEKTYNSIKIEPIEEPTNGQIVEYAISIYNMPPEIGWGNSSEFINLFSETNYYIFVRSAENNYYKAGQASNSLLVTTEKAIIDITGKTVAELQPIINKLTSAISNGGVAIINGSLTNATANLNLYIQSNSKVVWQASYISGINTQTLLNIYNDGLLEIGESAYIENKPNIGVSNGIGNAIVIHNGGSVVVNGGIVKTSNQGTTWSIAANGTNSSITVNSGTISANTGTAIYSNGNNTKITISGGNISATGTSSGRAIHTIGQNNFVFINDGSISAWAPVYLNGTYQFIYIYGGEIIGTDQDTLGLGEYSLGIICGGTFTGGGTWSYFGNSFILNWEKTTSNYNKGTFTDLSLRFSTPGALFFWDTENGKCGIRYERNTNIGFLEIEGIIVQ